MFGEDYIDELSEQDSWEFLGTQEFGRLAFHLLDEVHITPINYALDGHRIVFKTAEGSKLLGLTMNDDVAFEVDSMIKKPDHDEVTSVIVRGHAHTLEGSDAYVEDRIPLRPWVPTVKTNVVAVEASEITGRSFRLHRPWKHMAADHD